MPCQFKQSASLQANRRHIYRQASKQVQLEIISSILIAPDKTYLSIIHSLHQGATPIPSQSRDGHSEEVNPNSKLQTLPPLLTFPQYKR